LVVGSVVFDDVPVAARLFYGGMFGLVLGALIGAASALTGALLAALARRGDGRNVTSQRATFVVAGTATALVSSWAVLPPLSRQATVLLLVSLTAVTLLAGAMIGRRYIPEREA
jgi:hypothetical protein